jgi:hypothetical protein
MRVHVRFCAQQHAACSLIITKYIIARWKILNTVRRKGEHMIRNENKTRHENKPSDKKVLGLISVTHVNVQGTYRTGSREISRPEQAEAVLK